ncbi:hypothetical protein BDV97DRAFT_100704 [Delphinella strobiligena]|nr:hypothetical protein BDV97DRAFT_100704 [Delphinella strobiligena]
MAVNHDKVMKAIAIAMVFSLGRKRAQMALVALLCGPRSTALSHWEKEESLFSRAAQGRAVLLLRCISCLDTPQIGVIHENTSASWPFPCHDTIGHARYLTLWFGNPRWMVCPFRLSTPTGEISPSFMHEQHHVRGPVEATSDNCDPSRR